MRNGFTFKGRSSSDFAEGVRTERSVFPEVKEYRYDRNTSDGSTDFTEYNPSGRALYEDRIHKITLLLKGRDARELAAKISRTSAWLTGSGLLRFDDMLSFWYGRFIGGAIAKPKIYGTCAELELQFRSEPFSRFPSDTMTEIMDDSVLCETAALRDAGLVEMSTSNLVNSGVCAPSFYNIGTAPVRPRIKFVSDYVIDTLMISLIDEQTGNFSQQIGFDKNKSDELAALGIKEFVIDCECCTVKSADGVNLMPYVVGEFFELAPGETGALIRIAATAAKMQVIYVPRFFYDIDIN